MEHFFEAPLHPHGVTMLRWCAATDAPLLMDPKPRQMPAAMRDGGRKGVHIVDEDDQPTLMGE